ncbi:MAG: NAD(P)/FAD-dependent oxidoreductase, partial [Rhodoferax sp.]|nr:NAD(P)/FAD-dependent oxidoreductase [Rhodoferax sp.]
MVNDSLRAAGTPAAIETDALIIGAGPVGLFQAFQLGLLEISAHIVDALPYAGGQCVELYGDKPIYDIPGIPFCTGRELIAQLQKQVAPFKPVMHLGQLVSSMQRQADGRLLLETSSGTIFLAKTLFIAAGVGAFQPRMPNVEGLAAHVGKQVHLALAEDAAWVGRDVLVLGDSDNALQAAITLAGQTHRPKSVTLMHRRNVFTAEPATTAAFQSRVDAGQIRFVAGQPCGMDAANGQITGLHYLDADGTQQILPMDEVLLQLGLSPKLGAIAHWDLDMERRQLKVRTEDFATDQPGVFAVGDINTYPGKKK